MGALVTMLLAVVGGAFVAAVVIGVAGAAVIGLASLAELAGRTSRSKRLGDERTGARD
jgi:hypothetical protein